MPDVGGTPRRTVIAEDVRDLQSWTGHRRGRLCGRLIAGFGLAALAPRPDLGAVRHVELIGGLSTAVIRPVATRV